MIINFRHIQSFIVIAQLGGFRKAAVHLSISQPALTSHLKSLEAHLGVRLLSRTTRHVVLTPEGQTFLGCAQRALADLNLAVDELRRQAAVKRGRVMLGCTPSVAYSLIPRTLARFRHKYPDLEVVLFDDTSESLESRLIASKLDLVVGPAPHNLSDMDYLHLFDDPVMAIFPVGHELAKRATVPLKDLLRYELIAVRTGLRMRNIVQLAIAPEGYELKPVQEVASQYTVCALVEAGVGVGMMPQLIVSGINRQSLRAVRIVSPEISRRIGVITRHGEALTTPAERFVDLLKKEYDMRALWSRA